MRSFEILPEGYRKIAVLDLQKDKKTAWKVNLLAVLIGIVLAVPMHFVVPISQLYERAGHVKLIVLALSIVLYVILHELVHGIAMKLCGTKKIKYGFTGMYAFAGSRDYYEKGPYLFIALAPVVLWGVVLAVLCALVPTGWFWVVYIVQLNNLSGAAGDFFVTVSFSRLPKDILVRDYGVGMEVFSREGEGCDREEESLFTK